MPTFDFQRHPCVLLAGWYAVGRVTATLPVGTGSTVVLAACLFGLAATCSCFRRRTAAAATVAALAFLLGAWHGAADRRATVSGVPFADGEITGCVLETPEPTAAGDTLLRLRSGGLEFRLKVRPSARQAEQALLSLRRGDRVRAWARTGLPAAFANPGATCPGRSLRSAGIDRVGTVKSALLVEPLGSGEPGLLRWADQSRYRLRAALDRIAGSDRDARGLLGAMLLGDRGGLPPATLDQLRSAGLVHLIAVSGLHVGLILFLVLGVFRRLPGPLLILMA